MVVAGSVSRGPTATRNIILPVDQEEQAAVSVLHEEKEDQSKQLAEGKDNTAAWPPQTRHDTTRHTSKQVWTDHAHKGYTRIKGESIKTMNIPEDLGTAPTPLNPLSPPPLPNEPN